MNYIYTYLLGLATALVGILVKHFLDKSRATQITEQGRRQSACDKFRAAIAQEISLWHFCSKVSGSNPTFFALRGSSITAPVVEFRPFIESNVKDYDQTYKAYEQHKQRSLYVCGQGSAKAIELLENLLEFTEHKR